MSPVHQYLFVTLEAAGNWPPEIALIKALAERGHAVRVVSNANHAAQIRAAGATYEPYQHAEQRDPRRRTDDPTPEQLRVLRQVFFNPTFGEELLSAVARERPEVLVLDQMLIMASIAAETTRLPTAVLWHTVYGADSRESTARGRGVPRSNQRTASETRIGHCEALDGRAHGRRDSGFHVRGI